MSEACTPLPGERLRDTVSRAVIRAKLERVEVRVILGQGQELCIDWLDTVADVLRRWTAPHASVSPAQARFPYLN